ncbi:allantoinase AllB [Desulfofustis limnaeus]|uniref:Cyclic amidohydrolase n=1 Tax=Desulfofustis limnaeus TaxID=2740163 RepID=A0ABM7W5H2_9BACT|nr:allantoinase AllB [Desulfofustis limnaeus]BDD86185.1 cyclic amidohydrolase [Desulfofustis limnaeus]
MYDLLIRGGTVVFPEQVKTADIAVSAGKIAGIMLDSRHVEARKIIDARGTLVFPGAIDSHAHLNDPGFTWREDYAHGTAAAARGGVTTIVDMPMQNEPALTDKAIFTKKHQVVSANAYVDYCFWGGLVETSFQSLRELDECGVTAFKSFIGPVSPDYSSLSMGQVKEALEILRHVDARAGFHCEDYSIIKWEEKRAAAEGRRARQDFLSSRPVIAELIATKNILDLAKLTGAKVHICHVSHPDVAEVIRQAKRDGVDVTGETCPHYLVFSEQDLLEKGSFFKCAPPLRTAEDRDRMWEYILDGTFSCVGSDHSPCAPEEKDEEKHGIFGAWGGLSGIQSLFQVMFDQSVHKKGLSPSVVARCLAEGPAKAFGIYGKKGAIALGFDADLVLVDPDRQWLITEDSLEYLNKISAFCGVTGKGLPVCTVLRGQVVFNDDTVCGEKGYGKLICKNGKGE